MHYTVGSLIILTYLCLGHAAERSKPLALPVSGELNGDGRGIFNIHQR